jgi:peptidoglycan-associated lipoprotein
MGTTSPGGMALTEEERNAQLLSELTVYFDYDSSEIRADFNDMLRAHARQLAQNRNMRVRLEGHADERGSREYNIALGERRAQAVRQVLQLQGANSTQLSTVSYGEERPKELGHDDTSWAQNRRVELVYAN